MKLNDLKLQAGDIGLSTSNSLTSKIIKFFTSWLTSNAKKSHAFICIGDNLIIEASGKIRVNDISKYYNETVDIYRIPLNDADRKNLKLRILQETNRGYGWLKLPLFLADGVLTKVSLLFGNKNPVFFFTKYFGISSFRVCSQLVVWGIHKFTEYRFRKEEDYIVNWKTVSPDYLEDLLFQEFQN